MTAELKRVTATAAAALKAGDSKGWGWGEDIQPAARMVHRTLAAAHTANDSKEFGAQPALKIPRRLTHLVDANTRSLSVHANCIRGDYGGEDRFSNKEGLLKEINSWYL